MNYIDDSTPDLDDTAATRIVVTALSDPIASTTPLVVSGLVSAGGALVSAIDGECNDASYIVTQNEDSSMCTGATGCCVPVAAGSIDISFQCAAGYYPKALVSSVDLGLLCPSGEVAFTCQLISTVAPVPQTIYGNHLSTVTDTLYNVAGQLVHSHKVVPVTNEQCLYSLWMCACWANQADGCLCAFENSG